MTRQNKIYSILPFRYFGFMKKGFFSLFIVFLVLRIFVSGYIDQLERSGTNIFKPGTQIVEAVVDRRKKKYFQVYT
jgi:hypothetical protein